MINQENKYRFNMMAFSLIALMLGFVATLKGFNAVNGFWEDEFYQIAFINEKYSSLVFSVARLDIHPPLHYFQLKVWGEFFSSDKGLLLNSVFWHLISCLVIFYVGRAWKGVLVGLLAVSIYVLIPQVIWASVTLRQYSFLPAMAVGAWWLNMRSLSMSRTDRLGWAALAGIELALGYSHAIAFYFIPWIALAAAAQVYQTKRLAAPWKGWLITQGVVALIMLPLVFMALMRTGIPGNSAPSGNFLLFIGALVSGWGMKSILGLWLGLALYGLILILGLYNRETRLISIFILVGPLLLALLITVFVAPMLKAPVYSSILIPFATLVLADALSKLREQLGFWLSVSILISLMAAVFPATNQLLSYRFANPWQEVATEVKKRGAAGDFVVIAKPFSYWAVMRYAVGSDWGAPIEVLPSLNAKWTSLVLRLGPSLSKILHLVPKTDHVANNGITYVIGDDVSHLQLTAKRIWVIHALPYDVTIHGTDGYVDRGTIWRGEQRIELRLLEQRLTSTGNT